MSEDEAQQFCEMALRLGLNARVGRSMIVQHDTMEECYEVAINGGDPRGVRVWLRSPRRAVRYLGWIRIRAGQLHAKGDL